MFMFWFIKVIGIITFTTQLQSDLTIMIGACISTVFGSMEVCCIFLSRGAVSIRYHNYLNCQSNNVNNG